jgi:predicted RNA polymerase sigma factor
VHAQRAATGTTDWEAVALLYEGLVRTAPTIGALVGRAAAVAEAHGAARGWALLEAIPGEAVERYQPYWALAAHLLTRLERRGEAVAAYDRAIGLSQDPATREYLTQRRRP